MDFEKIKTDFEKRYNKKCEKIYFTGLPLEFFSENTKSISGCVSLGEAMAFAKREDGRITLEFSGTDSMASFNVAEIDAYSGQRFAGLLKKAGICGITLGGADIFVFKNSRITDLLEPLTLGGLSAFCEKVPGKEKLLPHFENYTQNMMALSGKSKRVTLFDGQRISYLPFFGGKCRIVITHTGGEVLCTKNVAKASLEEEVTALKKGDTEKFGYLLDKYTQSLIENNKWERQKGMFLAAKSAKDAIGNGVMQSGGVFSVVEDSKTDRFIREVSAIYRKYYGAEPDFYVTDFVDSGYFAD